MKRQSIIYTDLIDKQKEWWGEGVSLSKPQVSPQSLLWYMVAALTLLSLVSGHSLVWYTGSVAILWSWSAPVPVLATAYIGSDINADCNYLYKTPGEKYKNIDDKKYWVNMQDTIKIRLTVQLRLYFARFGHNKTIACRPT